MFSILSRSGPCVPLRSSLHCILHPAAFCVPCVCVLLRSGSMRSAAFWVCCVRVLLRSAFCVLPCSCSAAFCILVFCHVHVLVVFWEHSGMPLGNWTPWLYILTKLKCRPRPCPQPLLPWGGGWGPIELVYLFHHVLG